MRITRVFRGSFVTGVSSVGDSRTDSYSSSSLFAGVLLRVWGTMFLLRLGERLGYFESNIEPSRAPIGVSSLLAGVLL